MVYLQASSNLRGGIGDGRCARKIRNTAFALAGLLLLRRRRWVRHAVIRLLCESNAYTKPSGPGANGVPDGHCSVVAMVNANTMPLLWGFEGLQAVNVSNVIVGLGHNYI